MLIISGYSIGSVTLVLVVLQGRETKSSGTEALEMHTYKHDASAICYCITGVSLNIAQIQYTAKCCHYPNPQVSLRLNNTGMCCFPFSVKTKETKGSSMSTAHEDLISQKNMHRKSWQYIQECW